MKLYEIETGEKEPSPIGDEVFERFVILADTFDEAKNFVDKYIKNQWKTTRLIIHSIHEKYIIKMNEE